MEFETRHQDAPPAAIQLEGCEGIRVDVTGNCNLRCPYCINDFSQIHGNTLMTPEVFDSVVQLLPLLRPEGHLLFSCFFEPTIHPQFLDLLQRVPGQWRSRGGFTTNLGRRLPDTFFERLVELNVRYVNVSLDSLDPKVFEEMRKGIHFDVFTNNLERLVEFVSRSRQAPEIHFISMVSKLNLAEIPELIGRCSELYRPKRHEIRGIWMTPEIAQRPWIQNHAISGDEVLMLRSRLSNPPPHVDLVFDLPANPKAFTQFPAKTENRLERFITHLGDSTLQRAYSLPMAPILQISSDGIVRFLIAEPDLKIDLKSVEDPLQVVGPILELQNLNVARAALLRKSTVANLELKRINLLNQWLDEGSLKLVREPKKTVGCLDEGPNLSGTPSSCRFRFSGWATTPLCSGPAEEVILVARQGGKRKIVGATAPENERVDVALSLKAPELLLSGWTLEFQQADLATSFEGEVLFEAYAFDSSTRTGYRMPGGRQAVIHSRREDQAEASARPDWLSSFWGSLRRSK